VAALQRTSSTITSASLQEMSVQMKLFVLNVARIIMVDANRTSNVLIVVVNTFLVNQYAPKYRRFDKKEIINEHSLKPRLLSLVLPYRQCLNE
jgi:hypothetical protein